MADPSPHSSINAAGRKSLGRLEGLIHRSEKVLAKIPGAEFLEDFNIDENSKEFLRFNRKIGLNYLDDTTGEIVELKRLPVYERLTVAKLIPAFIEEAIVHNESAWDEVDEACDEIEQALVRFEK